MNKNAEYAPSSSPAKPPLPLLSPRKHPPSLSFPMFLVVLSLSLRSGSGDVS